MCVFGENSFDIRNFRVVETSEMKQQQKQISTGGKGA